MNAAGEEAATGGQGENSPPSEPPPPRWIGPGLRSVEPDFDDIGRSTRLRTVIIGVVTAAILMAVTAAIIWYVAS